MPWLGSGARSGATQRLANIDPALAAVRKAALSGHVAPLFMWSLLAAARSRRPPSLTVMAPAATRLGSLCPHSFWLLARWAIHSRHIPVAASATRNGHGNAQRLGDICDYVGWFSALHVSFGAASMCLVRAGADRTYLAQAGHCYSFSCTWRVVHWPDSLLIACLSERLIRNHAPRLHRAVFQLLGLAQEK